MVTKVLTEPTKSLTEHTQEYYANTTYLNTVESTKENIWQVKMTIDKEVINFKADPGTEIAVLMRQCKP